MERDSTQFRKLRPFLTALRETSPQDKILTELSKSKISMPSYSNSSKERPVFPRSRMRNTQMMRCTEITLLSRKSFQWLLRREAVSSLFNQLLLSPKRILLLESAPTETLTWRTIDPRATENNKIMTSRLRIPRLLLTTTIMRVTMTSAILDNYSVTPLPNGNYATWVTTLELRDAVMLPLTKCSSDALPPSTVSRKKLLIRPSLT